MTQWLAQHLAPLMFAALALLLFSGYPVGLVLGGLAIAFGSAGIAFGAFEPIHFANLMPRIFGAIAANQILVAIPLFIFMGTVLERSGVATELLRCLQLLLRRVPGGLALAVTAMGTIMAATTGIVGASVIMLTLIALPAMLERGYDKALATGTIASAGTLGILIPPSIMLVVLGDLLSVSVATLFAAALLPGLLLAALYFVYIAVLSRAKPALAAEGLYWAGKSLSEAKDVPPNEVRLPLKEAVEKFPETGGAAKAKKLLEELEAKKKP